MIKNRKNNQKTRKSKDTLLFTKLPVRASALVLGFATILVLGVFGVIVYGGVSEESADKLFPVVVRHEIKEQEGEREYEGSIAAVIVDNFEGVRPQSGLNNALFVIEAPAEGGVTRLLAFFSLTASTSVERIGPVRSARPYFVDWAQAYGALLVHVGGSPEALQQLAKGDVQHINEFYSDEYFWRDRRIIRPHNTFTNTKLLKEYGEKESVASTTLTRDAQALAAYFENNEARNSDNKLTTKFCDSKKMASVEDGEESAHDHGIECAHEVIIDFSFPEYKVVWEYDEETKVYARSQGGELQTDVATGEPLIAKTVVIQVTDITTIDTIGRKRLRTEGGGDVLVFYEGEVIPASWERERADMLRIENSDGEMLQLPYDYLWWEVVSDLDQVAYE